MARRAQGSDSDWTAFPGVPALLMLLIIIPFVWPWVVLHGTARWVVGVIWTVLVDLPVIAAFVAVWWKDDERVWESGLTSTGRLLKASART